MVDSEVGGSRITDVYNVPATNKTIFRKKSKKTEKLNETDYFKEIEEYKPEFAIIQKVKINGNSATSSMNNYQVKTDYSHSSRHHKLKQAPKND